MTYHMTLAEQHARDMEQYRKDHPPCHHPWVNKGPRIPLRFGSAETVVCSSCGCWTQTRWEKWQIPAELALAFQDEEESFRVPSFPG
jgi:hypothetical protein